jgi:hypothetical protein
LRAEDEAAYEVTRPTRIWRRRGGGALLLVNARSSEVLLG